MALETLRDALNKICGTDYGMHWPRWLSTPRGRAHPPRRTSYAAHSVCSRSVWQASRDGTVTAALGQARWNDPGSNAPLPSLDAWACLGTLASAPSGVTAWLSCTPAPAAGILADGGA